MSARSTIHKWWPIAAFLSFVLALQVVFANSIVANGKHASDHLQSAQVIFPIAFFLAVIFWAAREARRHVDAWVSGAMVGIACFVVALGNLRVIWAIGGDSWTDAQAGALGSARPGFDSGHSLVEIGTTAGVAAIVLFIAVLRTHPCSAFRPKGFALGPYLVTHEQTRNGLEGVYATPQRSHLTS